ncbi:hypothetical protein KEJ48_01360, partial [Candidatus Bathyarchaeota archaeon]|nr:hypothetical protein [Candidatus Bathyarchaeota archaeon]
SLWKAIGEPKKISLEEFEHLYRSGAEVRAAIDTLAEMVEGVSNAYICFGIICIRGVGSG